MDEVNRKIKKINNIKKIAIGDVEIKLFEKMIFNFKNQLNLVDIFNVNKCIELYIYLIFPEK